MVAIKGGISLENVCLLRIRITISGVKFIAFIALSELKEKHIAIVNTMVYTKTYN